MLRLIATAITLSLLISARTTAGQVARQPAPEAPAAPTPGNAHSGVWSCKLSTPGFPTSWSGPWQKVECTPGSTYVLKLWVKGQDQMLKLIVNDDAWKEVTSVTANATPVWTELSTPPFETGERTSLVIQLQDTGFYDGNTYLDDVFVGEMDGENRVVNAGFEKGGEAWSVPAPFCIERAVSFDVHDGVRALRLTASGEAAWKGPFQQLKGCPTESTVVCEAWIKGNGQQVKLVVTDASWNPVAGAVVSAGPTWTEVSTGSFETGQNTSFIVQLQDAGTVAGAAYMDGIFLGAAGGANMVRNPGFEYGDAYWSVETPFAVVMADKAATPTRPPEAAYSGPTGLHVPEGYRLVFSDDFSGAELDRGAWLDHYTCYTDHFHDEMQRYRPYGVAVADGVCTLQARPAELSDVPAGLYSSGMIQTRKPFKHGYVEARIKLPRGKGFWPAFWLTSAAGRWPPEWDIFEVADVPGRLYGYPHPVQADDAVCEWVDGIAGPDQAGLRVIHEPATGAPDIYSEFVTYGFLWTSTDVIWYVNDVMTQHYRVNPAAGADDPMWLLINLGVGGTWPGSPDETTAWPGEVLIDYVKIWQP